MTKIARKHQVEALEAINNINEGIIHLPTGTGKTFIQASAVVNNISKGNVFVVLTPRILLTNQLYNEIKKDMVYNEIDCQYLIVHSGKKTNDDMEWIKHLPYRDVKSTTSAKVIREDYDRAVKENVPLLIFCTYDSADRIVSASIPVYMLLCDEAHHIVTEEFEWIRYENYNDGRLQFNAKRKYYFTATLKNTRSDEGLGMNNIKEFGPILYSKKPIEMIKAGEIVRPRMHLVDVSKSDENATDLDRDINAIVDSFTEHRIHCNIGAKVLVIAKGTEHLNNIVNHPKMIEALDIRPKLTIFDISSEYGARINGQKVKREDFLNRLKNLTDSDEAIIIHVRILTEGIDVPGITGIMPLNTMNTSEFLQTLGRATRLYYKDRDKLYNSQIKSHELDKFVKPYAWVIIPIYDRVIGADMKENIANMISDLRTYDFNAVEDVVIKQINGKAKPEPLDMLNVLDTRGITIRESLVEIVHNIEEKEKAEKLQEDDFRLSEQIKNESIEDTIKRFANF